MPIQAGDQAPQSSSYRLSPTVFILFLSAAVFLLDQATKAFMVQALSHVPSTPVIDGVFHLTLVQNTGVAFGLLRGYSGVVAIGTLVIIAGLFWSVFKQGEIKGQMVCWALGLILGGAVGNLVDRVRVGHVIDFLDFRVWPVFNVADTCISIGAGLMILQLIRRR